MKTALESYGGVKGVRVAVVQVDTTKEITANKIPGISLLNKFSFEENNMHLACIQCGTHQILIIQ